MAFPFTVAVTHTVRSSAGGPSASAVIDWFERSLQVWGASTSRSPDGVQFRLSFLGAWGRTDERGLALLRAGSIEAEAGDGAVTIRARGQLHPLLVGALIVLPLLVVGSLGLSGPPLERLGIAMATSLGITLIPYSYCSLAFAVYVDETRKDIARSYATTPPPIQSAT